MFKIVRGNELKKLILSSASVVLIAGAAHAECSSVTDFSGYTYVWQSCQTSSYPCEFMDRNIFTGSLALFVSDIVYDDGNRYVESEFFDEISIQFGRAMNGSTANCHRYYDDALDQRRSFIADRVRKGYQIIYVRMNEY